MNEEKIRIPVILGPTAVGKTAAALACAQALDADILSCDSRQVYRYMDIGTAKPGKSEREKVIHHCVDICDPSTEYSAFDFGNDARRIIRECHASGRRVIVCGGTGLYFRALSSGLTPVIASDAAFREECRLEAALHGAESLHRRLAQIDPQTAVRLHPNDVMRVTRALQVHAATGVPFSQWTRQPVPPDDMVFDSVLLTLPREELHRRINSRTAAMFSAGLWDEFVMLRRKGYAQNLSAMQSPGYRELFAVEEGSDSLTHAQELVAAHSRQYAKRQMTWFSHQVKADTVDAGDLACADTLTGRFDRFFEQER